MPVLDLAACMASGRTSRSFPGFSGVHLLGEPGNSRAFRGDVALDRSDALAVTRAEKRLARVQVRWTMGRAIAADVIWSTLAAPLLVSDRVVDLLEGGGFCGWKTYPVELSGKDGSQINGYHGLSVDGRCGTIDNARSERVDKLMPGGVFPVWRGVYFDEATWDGSDLFMPANTWSWIFVVEAVRRAFTAAKVKNVCFNALPDIDRITL